MIRVMQATCQNHIMQQVTHARLGAQLNCILYRLKTGIKNARVLNSSPHIQQFLWSHTAHDTVIIPLRHADSRGSHTERTLRRVYMRVIPICTLW